MVRNDDLLKGVAIGIGVVVLVPMAIAALAPVVKPLVRSAMKTGVRVYEKGRETLEEFGETVEDIVAEVEEEMIDAHEAKEAVMEAAETVEASVSTTTPGVE
jgi:hypothetical protein